MTATRVLYEGRVQGVGFRWTARNLAKEFDVTGTVKNLPDGRVELVAAGEPAEVSTFLDAMRDSSLAGHVSAERRDEFELQDALRGFQIVP
jgi:acylphosphatase